MIRSVFSNNHAIQLGLRNRKGARPAAHGLLQAGVRPVPPRTRPVLARTGSVPLRTRPVPTGTGFEPVQTQSVPACTRFVPARTKPVPCCTESVPPRTRLALAGTASAPGGTRRAAWGRARSGARGVGAGGLARREAASGGSKKHCITQPLLQGKNFTRQRQQGGKGVGPPQNRPAGSKASSP